MKRRTRARNVRGKRRGAQSTRLSRPPAAVLLVAAPLGLVPLACLPALLDPFQLPKQVLLVLVSLGAAFGLVQRGQTLLAAGWIPRLVIAGLVIVAASTAFGVDPLGSILGNNSYRDGLVTYVALGLLLLATGMSIRTTAHAEVVMAAGAVGAVLVGAYAMVQWSGHDPVSWKLSGVSVSSLGNPNDLAGYEVLAVAFAGVLLSLPIMRRWGWLVLGGYLSLVALAVIASESRSGIAGLVVALAGLLVVSAAVRRSTLIPIAVTCAAVVLASGGMAVATGRASDLGDRFSRAISDQKGGAAGIDARADIWRGSLASLRAHPILGLGPDGLLVDFPRHEPANLGYPFDRPTPEGADPLVASPHDVIIELGLAGGPLLPLVMLAILVLVAGRYWRLLRTSPAQEWLLFIGPAVLGYGIVELFNPLALTGLAVIAVLGGMVCGLSEPATEGATAKPRSARPARWPLGAATVIALGFFGFELFADWSAKAAQDAAAIGDIARAADLAERAARLFPLDQVYRREDARAQAQLALQASDAARFRDAEMRQEQFFDDFPGLAIDHLALARIRLIMGEPGVAPAVAAARAASPHGPATIPLADSIEGAANARGLR